MTPMFVGLFIALFGGLIIANSAFTERGTLGFILVLAGLLLFAGGAVELAIQFFFSVP